MMRITARDKELFLKINEVHWLTTGQIGRYFFPGKAWNAVNKRMRKLVHSGFLFCGRRSSTEEYLYRLTGKSRQLLVEQLFQNPEDVVVPKRLPRNLQHFVAINNLRYAFESAVAAAAGEMILFAADRDIKRINPRARLIPDGIVRFDLKREGIFKTHSFFLEYDNGTENPGYFAKTKIRNYVETLRLDETDSGSDDFRVLIFADNLRRVTSLMRHTVKFVPVAGMFLFTVMNDLQDGQGIFDPLFLDPFDFFTVTVENGKSAVLEKAATGNVSLRHYSLYDLPVLSGCPDDRTVLSL